MPRPASWIRAGWETVVCCASGPSFSEQQAAVVAVARAREACRVVVVNDNWRRVPSADVLYACDGRWWIANYADVALSAFGGELWTQDKPAAQRFSLCHVKHLRRPGLTKTAGTVHGGGNSGYQAINLAYLLGAHRIILVGYDMQPTGGQLHWFGRHTKPELDRQPPFTHWIGQFADLARDMEREGVDVINASPETALRQFRREPLERALYAATA